MIKEPAEHHLTVSPVLRRIQHVRMPDAVNHSRRHDRRPGKLRAQLEEAPVQLDALIRLIQAQTFLTRIRTNELVDDRLEIKRVNPAIHLA